MNASDAASPCRNICILNEAGICLGCGRTRSDVARWLAMSLPERIEANRRAKERLARLESEKALAGPER